MKFIIRHLGYAVTFIFLASGLMAFVALNLEFLNPFEKALKDFQVTDLAFSRFQQDRYFEDRIVLVNFGHISRGQLAVVLDSIARYEPAAVGIDAFFSKPKKPAEDFRLHMAMRKIKNLVLVSKLDSFDVNTNRYRHLKTSTPLFHSVSHSGFANFITGGEDGTLTTRRFTPVQPVGDTAEHFLGVEMLRLSDPEHYQKVIDRGNDLETIRYNGNIGSFFRVDYPQILNGTANLEILRGKYVLVGYMGEPMGRPDLEDIFFTPLNENIAGRSLPDMFGVVVHANILSMMLRDRFIDRLSNGWDIFFALLFAIANGALFLYWAEHKRAFFEIGVRIVQTLQLLAITAVTIYLLSHYHVKLRLGLSTFIVATSGDFVDIYHSALSERIIAWRKKAKALNWNFGLKKAFQKRENENL